MFRFSLYFLVTLFTVTTCFVFSATADPRYPSISPRLRGMVANSYLNPEDLSVLASWKANSISVLLVIFPAAGSANREEYFAQLDLAMTRLDALLLKAAALNMRVLVNIYDPPGGFVRDEGKVFLRLFKEAWAQQALIDAWDIIAARYKDNQTIWGFQLLNEPAFRGAAPGLKTWNQLAQTLAENIRRVSSKHSIVVNPPFGDPAKLKTVRPIKGVSNVVYSVNMYHPFTFSHQGLIDGYRPRSYPSTDFRKTLMKRYFNQVRTFQKRVKTPIHIHEFSAARWAPNGSTARWLKDALTFFEKYKWSWNYHAFKEAGVWNVELTNQLGEEVQATSPTDRLKVLQSFYKKKT